MPLNNNPRVGLHSAAARLSKLPVVRSACVKLAVVYTDTKRNHSGIKSVSDVLERSVTAACHRFSPVIVKLEPQISIANNLACKSLDWLEDSFPVLRSPTEQIVATAQNKMHEIQSAFQHIVMWVMFGVPQCNGGVNQSLVEKAISVANVGLDSALSLSEALVDQVLPPAEDKEQNGVHWVEGFEHAQVKRCYPERIITLSTKLCKRAYRVVGMKVQSGQDLQTASLCLIWRLQELPQYLQHLAVSVFLFMIHLNHWSFSSLQHVQSCPVRSRLNAEIFSPQTDVVHVRPQIVTARRKRRPQKTSAFESDCEVDRWLLR